MEIISESEEPNLSESEASNHKTPACLVQKPLEYCKLYYI